MACSSSVIQWGLVLNALGFQIVDGVQIVVRTIRNQNNSKWWLLGSCTPISFMYILFTPSNLNVGYTLKP